MFEQGQQRAFAIVEGDVVEIVEHPRLAEFAQFGIDEAAAKNRDDRRVVRLDRLRDAKRAIHVAGEGRRHQYYGRRMPLHGCQRQLVQDAVDQIGRCRQSLGERVERGLALCQRLRIAHELKARIDRVAQYVGDIVKVQGGKVPGAILHPECAECPGQRIAAIRIDIGVEWLEAWPFGKKVAAADAMPDRRVAPLQESHGRFDRRQIAIEDPIEGLHPLRALLRRRRRDALAHRQQSVAREQAQHQGQSEILLHRVDAARTQETGQIGRRRIGRVELRHRRDDGEDAHGLGVFHAQAGYSTVTLFARLRGLSTSVPFTSAA